MDKGAVKGIAKASAVVLSLLLLAFFSVFYVIPVFAEQIMAGTVTTSTGARNVDTLQLVTLVFSVNKTTAGGNITNVTVNFDGSGWTVPSSNSSVTCTSPGAVPFSSIVTGTWVTCNVTTGNNFTIANIPFNVTIANLRSPASAQTSTFAINMTNTSSGVNTTTASITVTQLNATATVTPTTSVISAAQTYIFTINNVGSDQLDRINISYSTAGFIDTEPGNVTCPTISGDTWTAAVSTASDSITCTKSLNDFPAGSLFNVTVSNFIANNTGGLKNFYVDVRGTLGGNYTILANPPNVTVYGTASTTFANSVIANQTVGAAGIRVIGLNISATGETLNLTAVRVFLLGNGTSADIFNVSLHEGATPLASTGGTFSGSPLAVNLSLTSPLNIIAGTSRLINVTFNISTSANAGDTVGVNVTGNGSITLIGNSSALAVVTGGTPTGLSTNILIFGNITIVAANGVVANMTPGQANFIAANVTVTAGGESLTSISLGVNTTATNLADFSTLLIYRDTSCDGSVAGDTLVANRAPVLAEDRIALTGQTVTRDATNCYVVAYNISSTAISTNVTSTGNRLNVSIGSANVTATGAGSGLALTSAGTAVAPTTTAVLYGNLTITGTSRVAATTAIDSRNVTVISYNFSATGENITVHEINITIIGSVAAGNISNVTLYNGTSDNGIFDGSETFIANLSNVTGAGSTFSLKLATPLQIPSGGTNVLLVVFYIAPSSGNNNLTGGSTFGANLSANTIRGNSSTIMITPVITTQFSSTSILYGNLTVSGADLTPVIANTGQTDVRIINLTFTASGEAMNVSLLNITLNNTNNNDVTAVKLYNGTSIGSLIATATKSGNIAAFGTAGGTLYVVPAGSSSSLVVTFDINSSATGGNGVDAFLNRTADVVVNGGASNVSITIIGTPVSPTGNTTIDTLSATATVTPASALFNSTNNYTFTITNGGGTFEDTIDQIVINYTAAGYVDTETANITCPVAFLAWTAAVDPTLNTITCTGGTPLAAGASGQVNVTNFRAPVTGGNKQFDVTVRGKNGGGTFAITTNKPSVAVGGSLTITGTNQNPTTTAIGTSNVTAIAYLFNTSGEAMNVSQINITRTGTATTSDIVSVKLIQDSNVDNIYQNALDTNVLATQTANATPDIYSFSSLNLQIPDNMTILVVFNISSSATGARTFGANIAAANVTVVGNASGSTITATVITSNSSLSTIYGTLAMTAADIAPANVSQGQNNVTYLRLNFSATGETFNVTEINITKLGTLPIANSTILVFNDTDGSNTWSAADASIGSNTTSGNRTAVSFQVVPGTPKIIFVLANITASQSGDKTFGLQVIGSNISAITNATSISITPSGGVASSTTSSVQAQANIAVGTLASTSVWITNSAYGNNSLILTIPVTNNGNATATAVNLSRTITLLNFTNQSINGNFTITQTDVITTVQGNGTQVNLVYNITPNSSAVYDGSVNVNVSIGYNDTNTQVASVNSPATSFTLAVFSVDRTAPVVTRNALDSPGNNSAVNGTIIVNVTATDASSGMNGSSSTVRMIVANGTTTLIFNMTNSTTAMATWNTSFISTNFADGLYNISFNATDVAGNSYVASNILRITVDNTLPAFSGEVVNDTSIVPLQLTDFSINITERAFNASSVLISVLNFTNVTVRTATASCTAQGSFVFRCNMTWDGTNDTNVNVSAGTYRFRINVTDNATQFATANSTNTVTVSMDTTAPTISAPWSPNSASSVTTSTPSLEVNTSEAATCKFENGTDIAYASMAYTMTGTSTTHNFTFSLLDKTYNFWVRCTDSVGNAMTSGQQITFTVDTRNIRNITLPNGFGDYFFSNNWNGFELPLFRLQNTSVANTNVTTVLASLTGNFSNFYGYDGTSWKSFQPGAAVNSFANFTYDAAGTSYYIYINTTSSERLEIP